MARPTKLTPKIRDKIVQALRCGCYAETAAELAGVPDSTYYVWLQRGRAALAKPASPSSCEAIYAELVEAVTAANAAAEADAIDVIRRDEDWRAAAFYSNDGSRTAGTGATRTK
jgi:hypothetical protein